MYVPNIPTPTKVWASYAEDLFVKFPSNHDDYLMSLNKLSDSIKFRVECKRKLPLLDILVRRTESNFEYSVYRKPTTKNALLHFFYFHEIKKKSV